jgi:hypothetical protein
VPAVTNQRPPWWDADDELLDALGEALREGVERDCRAVPPGFVAAGKAAYAWCGVDAGLASLRYESSVWPALVRATAPAVRMLTYRAGDLTVELEVTASAVQGQLVPARPGWVDVRPGPGASVEADDLGYFVIRPAPRGPFRLRCQAAGVVVLTGWIEPPHPAPIAAPARRRLRRQPPD